MHYQDYYKILGVPRDASMEDIRKSFRKLGAQISSGRFQGKDAEERMKEVNEAYTGKKKARRLRSQWPEQSGRAGIRAPAQLGCRLRIFRAWFRAVGGGRLFRFFAELFGRMGAAPRNSTRAGLRSAHVELTMHVPDILNGASAEEACLTQEQMAADCRVEPELAAGGHARRNGRATRTIALDEKIMKQGLINFRAA